MMSEKDKDLEIQWLEDKKFKLLAGGEPVVHGEMQRELWESKDMYQKLKD